MKHKIKIFTYAHKDFKPLFNDGGVYHIISGNKLNNEYNIPNTFIGEDCGIYEKRNQYGEMTAIYYIYKHQELINDVDYVGLQHYSRWFDLTNIDEVLDNNDCVMIDSNNHITCSSYAYQKSFHNCNPELMYCLEYLTSKDFSYTNTIFKDFLNPGDKYWCNMFIMKKEDFIKYAKWVFDIIENMNKYFSLNDEEDFIEYQEKHRFNLKYDFDQYYIRLNGYIGEILTSLYVSHNFKKIKKIPIIMNK